MIEWETQSPGPVPGARAVVPVLPEKWPVDLLQTVDLGLASGPWRVFSAAGLDGRNMANAIAGLTEKMGIAGNTGAFSIPRLNYHFLRGSSMAGGWVAVTDQPAFPLSTGGCAALHVATVRLAKPGTWSFDMHGDDYFAIRFPGLKWKSSTGLGGIDPLDNATLFHSFLSGDGHVIGVIDLPAGDSRIEVLLGNNHNDTMIQLLAAKGDIKMDGGTDRWRFPGHKAAGDLAWPVIDAVGWIVTRTDRRPGAAPLANLTDALTLARDGGEPAEGAATINYIDSDGPGNVLFPEAARYPGDKPGGQDQFVVRATGKLVIPRDGVYHIGIHADGHCALRITGQMWKRVIRDTGYVGKLEKDTIYGEEPADNGSNVQLVAEIELKMGTYEIEALYADLIGPSVFSVFGAPAGFAPRLLAKDGARIEPDIDGLPLVTPGK